MSISPQKFREILFQLLYSSDFIGGEEKEIIPMLMGQLSVTKKVVTEACAVRVKVEAKLPLIDERIKEHSKEYGFDRIPRVERNILRLGVYELLFSSDIPPKVAISEAIRLSRKFSTPESAAFINAILDAIFHATAQ